MIVRRARVAQWCDIDIMTWLLAAARLSHCLGCRFQAAVVSLHYGAVIQLMYWGRSQQFVWEAGRRHVLKFRGSGNRLEIVGVYRRLSVHVCVCVNTSSIFIY